MIKVTLEFANIDHALVELAKLTPKGAKALAAVSQEPAAGAVALSGAPAEGAGRKGRSDKGQKRGPHKADEQKELPLTGGEPNAAPQGSATVVAGTAQVTGGSTPQPGEVAPAVAAPTAAPATPPAAPTLEDAQAALKVLFDTKGAQRAMGLLASHDVKRVAELPADKRAEFIAECKKATAE